jgi:hypothetical protein
VSIWPAGLIRVAAADLALRPLIPQPQVDRPEINRDSVFPVSIHISANHINGVQAAQLRPRPKATGSKIAQQISASDHLAGGDMVGVHAAQPRPCASIPQPEAGRAQVCQDLVGTISVDVGGLEALRVFGSQLGPRAGVILPNAGPAEIHRNLVCPVAVEITHRMSGSRDIELVEGQPGDEHVGASR